MSERIAERVRKLLELGRGNSHEALSARRKAEELTTKYGLAQADLEVPEESAVESVDYSTRPVSWIRDLGFAVGRSCSVQAVHTPHGKGSGGRSWLHFVGKPADVGRAARVFDAVRARVRRAASLAYSRYVHRTIGTKPSRWKADFCAGAVHAVDERMNAAANAREWAETVKRASGAARDAIVVGAPPGAITEAVSRIFSEVRVAPQGECVGCVRAWSEGRSAGWKLDLGDEKSLPGGVA